MTTPLIRRIRLRNYKSIAACDVALGQLMFLVGPNGAGKSSFLDAMRFVADGLRTSMDLALRERGGIKEVRRRSVGHPNHFNIRLDFSLPSGQAGHYAFRVGAQAAGGYEVQNEECSIASTHVLGGTHHFHVKSGCVVATSLSTPPSALSDGLYLVRVSGTEEFRPVVDALSQIEIYNLNPRVIAAMQPPDSGALLRRDGSNAASVLQHLPADARQRITEHLSRIVPGVTDLKPKVLGTQETITFFQTMKGQRYPWKFLAGSMSDGTLRAFGVLLAVFQAAGSVPGKKPPLLIGLEEPEMALHPAAAAVLLAALREASRSCQILVTSHSPELLDNADIHADSILAVENQDGITAVGSLDQANVGILRDKLFTAGELLRQNQLAADEGTLRDVVNERQLAMFEHEGR
jgi:predicted ATPase